jgi:hypothetical protein
VAAAALPASAATKGGSKPAGRPQASSAAAGPTHGAGGKGGGGAAGAGGGGGTVAAATLPERRATWSKMGVVALRDLGLEAVPPECFEGLPAAVRGADLSQARPHATPGEAGVGSPDGRGPLG